MLDVVGLLYSLAMQLLPWGMWDWWMYCSNKGCIHHEGEGVFQETPDWVEVIENA